MAKKPYKSPVFLSSSPSIEEPTIEFGGSVDTGGIDPRFEWDPEIDALDIEYFMLNYGETYLETVVDKNHDWYIDYDEFYDFLDNQ